MLNHKIHRMKYLQLTILIILVPLSFMFGQNTLKIDGGYLVQTGGNLVLEDSQFENNGTFTATGGTVKITGTESDANSSIGGTSSTTFNNLTIDKSSNNAILENNTQVANTLTLTSGHLDVQTSNLTIANTGTISGANSGSYVKTSSTGALVQEVSASGIVFPVGKQAYTPATVTNNGTTDNFYIRVADEVLLEGTSGDVVNSEVVDVTWFIDEETLGGSDVTLTLQWNTGEELTGFDRTQAFISHYDGSSWIELSTQASGGSNPYTISETNLTDFSPFTVSSNINVLPVELLDFTAKKEERNSRLNWQTATEINNEYFDVEWSTDGTSFKNIGSVSGAGTTTVEQEYTFLHQEPIIGVNYYRLKQVDSDGTFEYSNIATVIFSEDQNAIFSISPNPTNKSIRIETNYVGLIQLYNGAGQLLRSGNISSNVTWDLSEFPNGIYFLKAGHHIQKIVVQK